MREPVTLEAHVRSSLATAAPMQPAPMQQARTPQVMRQHWQRAVVAASLKAPAPAAPSAEQEAAAQAAGDALLAELEAEAQVPQKAAAKEKKVKRGVKEVVKAIRKKQGGCVPRAACAALRVLVLAPGLP